MFVKGSPTIKSVKASKVSNCRGYNLEMEETSCMHKKEKEKELILKIENVSLGLEVLKKKKKKKESLDFRL